MLQDRKVRRDQTAQSLADVLASDELGGRIEKVAHYLRRLGADEVNAPFFCNGVVVPRSEDWLQIMSQRLTVDLQTVQRAVYEERLTQDVWIPLIFVEEASRTRNPLLIPEDDKMVKIVDLTEIEAAFPDAFDDKSFLQNTDSAVSNLRMPMLLIGDFSNSYAEASILSALEFAFSNDQIALSLVHQGPALNGNVALNRAIGSLESLADAEKGSALALVRQLLIDDQSSSLPQHLGLVSGQLGVLLGGRLLSMPMDVSLTKDDFGTLFMYEKQKRFGPTIAALDKLGLTDRLSSSLALARLGSTIARSAVSDVPENIYNAPTGPRINLQNKWNDQHTCIKAGDEDAALQIVASVDPVSEVAQRWVPILRVLSQLKGVSLKLFLNPREKLEELPIKRFYRHVLEHEARFDSDGSRIDPTARFEGIPRDTLLSTTMDVPPSWLVAPKDSVHDLDNIKLSSIKGYSEISADYELEHILIEGHSKDITAGTPPRGVQLVLGTAQEESFASTIIMANLGYFQFKSQPGVYTLGLQQGRSQKIFKIDSADTPPNTLKSDNDSNDIYLTSFQGATLFPRLSRKPGYESEDVLEESQLTASGLVSKTTGILDHLLSRVGLTGLKTGDYVGKSVETVQKLLFKTGVAIAAPSKHADINIFSVASGHLYERMLNIMMVSVMRHTKQTVKFWFIEQFLSPSFKTFLPVLAQEYGFEFEMVAYKWPHWLRAQKEKQRVIWGYKILFLDVLFPLDLDKVIFVDADQIVRTDMYELVTHDLEGAPYGFTPMCDSRTEMEGFRFWKQGYWKNFLRGLPYHISALYVVDLKRFRQIAAGDRLRQQYHQLSADPNSLSNLDQDLPNHMQMMLPIHSLPQEWLWCETWCSDEALKEARTIDLCNNPLTKEPKLDRARRQVPEWTVYDDEIAALARRTRDIPNKEGVEGGILAAGETAQVKDEL